MRLFLKALQISGACLIAILATIVLPGCKGNRDKNKSSTASPIDSVAGNEDVARYLKSFKGLGALSDASAAPAPREMLDSFKIAGDLAVDLVLSEPEINQPVEISFDHRGRLWVVQYNQYPYPKGLKIMSVDNYLRVTFDKVPQAPPEGIKGADKITFFEDTNGDGIYDKSTDAISGLNIATSVAIGRGNIWVLNPPYLLAYPDPNDDGIPDGPPVVHVSGFGMQDTHAVANSLTWGPDGWLYGAQGSTTTSTISSSVVKDLFLQDRLSGDTIPRRMLWKGLQKEEAITLSILRQMKKDACIPGVMVRIADPIINREGIISRAGVNTDRSVILMPLDFCLIWLTREIKSGSRMLLLNTKEGACRHDMKVK